jgi:hypothetical protein
MRHTMGSLAVLAGSGVKVLGGGDVVGGAGRALTAASGLVKRTWAGLRSFVAAALHQAAETVVPTPRPVPVPQERVERFTASPGFEGDYSSLTVEEIQARWDKLNEVQEPEIVGVLLDSLTVKELRARCKECGVKVTCRMRKSALVAALEGRAA